MSGRRRGVCGSCAKTHIIVRCFKACLVRLLCRVSVATSVIGLPLSCNGLPLLSSPLASRTQPASCPDPDLDWASAEGDIYCNSLLLSIWATVPSETSLGGGPVAWTRSTTSTLLSRCSPIGALLSSTKASEISIECGCTNSSVGARENRKTCSQNAASRLINNLCFYKSYNFQPFLPNGYPINTQLRLRAANLSLVLFLT